MRRILKFTLPLLALLLPGLRASAQNVSDLIVSEVLPVPDSTGIVDDYGRRGAWIELFNTSQGTVNIGGCFLTDSRNDLKMSPIPKGDLKTLLGPRQSVVFYASGNGAEGTFYTSFIPVPGSTVYLVSNDGRTIVDSLKVPSSLPEGQSAAKVAQDLRQMDFRLADSPCSPTPGMMNSSISDETHAQKMARTDPHGFILSIVSVSVVFAALAVLWGLFTLLFRLLSTNKGKEKKKKKAPKVSGESLPAEHAAAIAMALDMEKSGDEYAAIAMAMHMMLSESVHDAEPFIITIRPSEGSAWKNKSLTFRKYPKKI